MYAPYLIIYWRTFKMQHLIYFFYRVWPLLVEWRREGDVSLIDKPFGWSSEKYSAIFLTMLFLFLKVGAGGCTHVSTARPTNAPLGWIMETQQAIEGRQWCSFEKTMCQFCRMFARIVLSNINLFPCLWCCITGTKQATEFRQHTSLQ